MTRLVLERFALFALPFVLFAVYAVALRGRVMLPRPGTPWFWLTASGLGLVIGSFVFARLLDGDTTAGRYVPPAYAGGKIVPGHVEETKQP